ncbi:uncharacterized protein LOC127565469 [Drosophila albomicans]|uniref:Uncharacterized protein LOC127565469 n=1 Tax=Drosophila albomicans TaxID=7291 RepID=A0A9C6SQC1_DROAB|nr:uncharacterized protein LOC127565469 [Drosophila albomicans]
MDILNDDTLMRIFGYLDLKSQQIITTIHPRFYDLMPNVWILQYKTVNISLFEANFSSESFEYFLEAIRCTVKAIRLRLMTWEHYEVLISKIFPNVEDFRFSTVPSNLLTDIEIPKIAKSFPNLRTFSPQGHFCGVHFNTFPKLERLTLTYCRRFFINNLLIIMKVCQLKEIKLCMSEQHHFQSVAFRLPFDCVQHLESIKIDIDELPWFERELSKLQHLKELTICGPRQRSTLYFLIDKLDCFRHKRHLKILETCNASNTLGTVINAGLQVDALKIVTDNLLLDGFGFFTNQMFANIKELYFKTCSISEEHSFESLIHNTRHLELVSVEQCLFGFDNYKFDIPQIVQNRFQPIRINLYQNVFEPTSLPWKWSTIGDSYMLQIIEGRNYEYSFEPVYIAFK